MAKTLTTIRSLTRGYLDEASAADWSDAELNVLINQRYHRVYTAVVAVFEDYYFTTSLFNTVANQQEYGSADSFPTNIYKIRRVEVDYNPSVSGSAPTRLLPINNIDFVRRDLGFENSGVASASNGNYYLLGYGSNAKIGFVPIPTQSGTNAAKIWYVGEVADLSSDSSEINIPYADRYYHLIVEGAVGDALRFGQQDSPEADKFDKKFDEGLGLMQQELEDRIGEEAKFVMDTSGDFTDFSTPTL